jgi:hypothetical protein
MRGPFARLEDFCQTQEKGRDEPCPMPGHGTTLTKVGPPYREVAWIRVAGGTAISTCYVAFKLAKGWFVEPRGDSCEDSVDLKWVPVAFEVTDLVPGDHKEVVLRSTSEIYDVWANEEGAARSAPNRCEAWLVACGVPAKGVPSCMYMQTGGAKECGPDGTAEWTWQLEPVFTAGGQVDVKATGKPDADARALMGRRSLAFP